MGNAIGMQIFSDRDFFINRLKSLHDEFMSLVEDSKTRTGYLNNNNYVPCDDYSLEQFDDLARSIFYKEKRISDIKNKIFGQYKSINENTWSIIIEIYLRGLDRSSVSIKHACLATGLASTTALRWVCALEEDGLVFREQDSVDGRRQYLHLTEICRSKLIEYIKLRFEKIDLPERKITLLT